MILMDWYLFRKFGGAGVIGNSVTSPAAEWFLAEGVAKLFGPSRLGVWRFHACIIA
tara:strand:+ start:1196 stop:1363 length:168 start_codon:yes stop_codon:yes gene_type:complete